MLIQNQIAITIANGKYYSSLMLNKIYEKESLGDDAIYLKKRFSLLNKWIEILFDYLYNNFDGNGNLTPPIFPCLTAEEAANLKAKIDAMVGAMVGADRVPAGSDWLLATGYWNDGGFWRDSATWYDTLPII